MTDMTSMTDKRGKRGRGVIGVAGLCIGVTVLGLVGCDEQLDTLGEATELAGEGNAKQLRDPARDASGAPRVLIFALDGVGQNALMEAVDGGAMPTLSALMGAGGAGASGTGGFEHGVDAGPVLSVLPSITLAAWTTLFTGATPGETGVPGNEWFDRGTGQFHAPAPVSVSGRGDALATLSDQLMDSLVATPTLFERADVRSYVSLLPLHRGADFLGVPGTTGLIDLFAAFPEGAAGDETVDRELYSAVDHSSARGMADLVREEGVPNLAVVYFPGIDLYTHATPDPLAQQRLYLAEVTDSAIAGVLSAYREAGALDSTYVIVVSDHGHTPVLNDAVHALGGDSAFSAQEALESAGFRVRSPDLTTDSDEHQAVMAWQGAFAYISLADRSTCPGDGDACAWPRPPRWEEDVLPAARALALAAAAHPSDPLDMIILRRDSGDGETGDLYVLDGDEPVALETHLAGSPRPELLAFVERMEWLTTGPAADHAGDVILMTRMGASLPASERYYFSKPYHSWHASAEEQDSHASLIVARSDMSGDEIRQRLGPAWDGTPSQLDFTSLVLRLLEVQDRATPSPSPGNP